jgi:orotidine-5'-phosphate decarboxylase
MDVARRTIVALDVDDDGKAMATVDRLGAAGRSYKVGLELLTAAGPGIVTRLVDSGKEVFLDLKLFEIPASVAGAVRAAGRLGVTMVTVHAMGGPAVMDAAIRAAAEFPRLRVIALTVVTSLVDADLAAVGLTATVEEQTVRLARLAEQTGCHGVVASPRDAAPLRADLSPDTLIITPGVSVDTGPTTAAARGHARPADAVAAVRDGATHVIVGRAVTRAPDPAAVLAHLHHRIATADSRRRGA